MTKKQQTKWMTKEEGWTFVPFKKEHPQAKKEKAEVRKISSSKVPQLYEKLWPLPSARVGKSHGRCLTLPSPKTNTINKEDAEMDKAREASLKSFKKEEEAEMRAIEQAIAASLELPKKKSAKKVQVRSRGKARGGTNTKTMSGSPSLPRPTSLSKKLYVKPKEEDKSKTVYYRDQQDVEYDTPRVAKVVQVQKVQVRSRGKAKGGTNTKTMSVSPSLPPPTSLSKKEKVVYVIPKPEDRAKTLYYYNQQGVKYDTPRVAKLVQVKKVEVRNGGKGHELTNTNTFSTPSVVSKLDVVKHSKVNQKDVANMKKDNTG